MVQLSSRRVLAGTALAFVGSTLTGTIIGLPTALAEAGVSTGKGVDGRALAALDSASVEQNKVVAGSGTISVASAISGASPTQLIKPLPALPTPPATGTTPVTAGTPGATSTTATTTTAAAMGIPGVMIDAYKKGAALTNRDMPSCQIDWTLLAAIGKVETDHAAGGRVDAAGNAASNLDGPSIAKLGGTRAVGPMQFLPSTWATSGRDGNGDGVKNVQNIYDATYAAGVYLCQGGGGSLTDSNHLHDAIFSYNHAEWYVQKVINLMNAYSGGVVAVPSQTGTVTVTPAPAPAPAPAPKPAPSNGGSTPTPSTTKTPTPTTTPSPSPTKRAEKPVSNTGAVTAPTATP